MRSWWVVGVLLSCTLAVTGAAQEPSQHESLSAFDLAKAELAALEVKWWAIRRPLLMAVSRYKHVERSAADGLTAEQRRAVDDGRRALEASHRSVRRREYQLGQGRAAIETAHQAVVSQYRQRQISEQRYLTALKTYADRIRAEYVAPMRDEVYPSYDEYIDGIESLTAMWQGLAQLRGAPSTPSPEPAPKPAKGWQTFAAFMDMFVSIPAKITCKLNGHEACGA